MPYFQIIVATVLFALPVFAKAPLQIHMLSGSEEYRSEASLQQLAAHCLKEVYAIEHLEQAAVAGNQTHPVMDAVSAWACDGKRIQYRNNARLFFEMHDPKPYEEGWFGFRALTSHIRIDDYKVYEFPKSEMLGARY